MIRRVAIPVLFALLAGAVLAGAAPAQPQPQSAGDPAKDAGTQFAMGEAYRLGKGVAISRDQAISWYRKAAAQGHAGAQDALGIMLFTKGDRKTAIPLLQAAAQRGDVRALYILGTAHFNGDAVPRDYPRAYAEMRRAAAGGLPEAQRNLAKMEPYLTPDDRAKAVAILAGRDLPAAPGPAPTAAPPPVTAQAAVGQAAAPQPQPTPPAPLPAPPTTAIRPATVAPVAAKPVAGRWRVQLGAYATATRAENQWAVFVGRVAGLGPLHHVVTQAGDYWRLQADGLPDRAAADAMCKRVVAAGGACFALAP